VCVRVPGIPVTMLTAFTELYGRDFFRLPPFFLGLVEILCEIFFVGWLAGWVIVVII